MRGGGAGFGLLLCIGSAVKSSRGRVEGEAFWALGEQGRILDLRETERVGERARGMEGRTGVPGGGIHMMLRYLA